MGRVPPGNGSGLGFGLHAGQDLGEILPHTAEAANDDILGLGRVGGGGEGGARHGGAVDEVVLEAVTVQGVSHSSFPRNWRRVALMAGWPASSVAFRPLNMPPGPGPLPSSQAAPAASLQWRLGVSMSVTSSHTRSAEASTSTDRQTPRPSIGFARRSWGMFRSVKPHWSK